MTFNRHKPINYQPVIIIGAARSGTNMLRDVITGLPGLGTWPCDEINYIWRHGNISQPDDEFGPALATEAVKRFIRQKFEQLARKQRLLHVVEKTCANSLRVGFVDRIFPEARYVYIQRDQQAVVASALKRWTAPVNWPYILSKARFVPPGDAPYYAGRFLWNRFYRAVISREKRLAFWGPRFKGMDVALQKFPLERVCAMQWQRCVERATHDLGKIAQTRVHYLRYEDIVRMPERELKRLHGFLGLTLSREQAAHLAQMIRRPPDVEMRQTTLDGKQSD